MHGWLYPFSFPFMIGSLEQHYAWRRSCGTNASHSISYFLLSIFQVIYMPLSVIITTFKKENVKRPLEGFGVLVPSKEQKNGLKTLGNAWLWLSDTE